MATDHSGVALGIPQRFQPDAVTADAAEEVTPPTAALYAVITPDGAAGKVAGNGTQTDGSAMSGNYVSVADGTPYTLQLVAGVLQINQARTFFVSSAGTSGFVSIQYVQ